MAFEATVYEVLIASPRDCAAEREVAQREIAAWNRQHGRARGLMFMPRLWELDAVPSMSADAQGVINKQLLERADTVLAMFWYRFGTPTREFDAGTVEEISRAHAANKDVWAYFCRREVPWEHDSDQLAKVRAFQQTFAGLYSTFIDEHQLRAAIGRTLTHFAEKRAHPAAPPEPERAEPVVADADAVGVMLGRLAAHGENAPVREVYQRLRDMGYDVVAPDGARATYLRFRYQGRYRAVRLYLNSAVLASSANGDREFAKTLEGATIRAGEVVFPLSGAGGADRVLAAASALKERANRV